LPNTSSPPRLLTLICLLHKKINNGLGSGATTRCRSRRCSGWNAAVLKTFSKAHSQASIFSRFRLRFRFRTFDLRLGSLKLAQYTQKGAPKVSCLEAIRHSTSSRVRALPRAAIGANPLRRRVAASSVDKSHRILQRPRAGPSRDHDPVDARLRNATDPRSQSCLPALSGKLLSALALSSISLIPPGEQWTRIADISHDDISKKSSSKTGGRRPALRKGGIGGRHNAGGCRRAKHLSGGD
jgi:hypothetical protein